MEARGAGDELLREDVGPGQYDAGWARLERRTQTGRTASLLGERAAGWGEGKQAPRRKRKRPEEEVLGALPDSGSNESSRTNGNVLCGDPGWQVAGDVGGEVDLVVVEVDMPGEDQQVVVGEAFAAGEDVGGGESVLEVEGHGGARSRLRRFARRASR